MGDESSGGGTAGGRMLPGATQGLGIHNQSAAILYNGALSALMLGNFEAAAAGFEVSVFSFVGVRLC